MTKTLLGFLNPIKWIQAGRFKRRQAKLDKASYDLELYLYSQLLTTDMLHFGYFEDPDTLPESISIADFEAAQIRYAERICQHVQVGPVLDVGCGMGGLSHMLTQRGFQVDGVTPNDQQVAYLRKRFPQVTAHHCKFQDLVTRQTYASIINSESLQYIPLEDAFQKVERLRTPAATWIICDYFKRHENTHLKTSHLLTDFKATVAQHGWVIALEEDITAHVLPTIRMGAMYANRFLKPGVHFGLEKLRYKRPGLYYMLAGMRAKAEKKVDDLNATVDPGRWVKDKQYMLFVLKKG
jgi:cyclopropane fatty-acyl-phospholipid synthase-like methyltransferase